MASPGRSSHLTAKLRQQVAARREPCWRCGQPIDYSLPWDKHRPDPGYFTLEHVKPLGMYPHLAYDPANCRASHHACNSAAQDRPDRNGPTVTTRQW